MSTKSWTSISIIDLTYLLPHTHICTCYNDDNKKCRLNYYARSFNNKNINGSCRRKVWCIWLKACHCQWPGPSKCHPSWPRPKYHQEIGRVTWCRSPVSRRWQATGHDGALFIIHACSTHGHVSETAADRGHT